MPSPTGSSLTFREKLAYGLGDTASNFFFQAFNIFLAYYYTDVVGIKNSAAVGTLLGTVPILVAALNPVIGVLADRTTSRWGKFRPWILWGALPYGVLGYVMFANPDFSPDGKLLFAYATYTLMLVAYAAINTPYSALMGVMSSSSEDRTSLSTYRFACAFLGALPSGWRYGHNRHHAAPNVRGIDGDQAERWQPDARYPSYFSAFLALLILRRVRGVRLPRSVLMLWIRDGFHAHRHAPERFRSELVAAVFGQLLQLACFCVLFGAWGPALYLLHTHIGLVFLNAVFLGNHYDLPSFDAPEHRAIEFAELQVVTSRNYPPSRLGDFFHGGLGYQIEHHLFPDLPRHGLRRAAPHVRAYCAARGLPYNEAPFLECILRALRFHLVPRAAQPH